MSLSGKNCKSTPHLRRSYTGNPVWELVGFIEKLARLLRHGLSLLFAIGTIAQAVDSRPNILIAISDDQSWPHASAYGNQSTQTPAFDRIAREGVLCNNAFVAYPSCSPSRASLLTGRYPWQIEHAGNFSGSFPPKYSVYPDILEDAGYWVGYTGKGWGPGDWRGTGRLRNPSGTEYNQFQNPSPDGISPNNYSRNFEAFLEKRPSRKPFVFWFGATEPHRRYKDGIGIDSGKQLGEAQVPAFLPDSPVVRSDILDYSVEIEWFDKHLGRMLDLLEERGELENTLVIVTSDNGMPFPRAKSNVYEYGLHVPMTIMWPERIPGGRVLDDMISFVDLAPTFLEAAKVKNPGQYPMAGRSLMPVLEGKGQGIVDPSRDAIVAGRERHGSARYKNYGYPQRVIRTRDYLYLRNFEPNFWPAGQPQDYDYDGTLRPMHQAYYDIDASPSKSHLVSKREDPAIADYFNMAMAKRPAEELYDIRNDPACVNNLAKDPEYATVKDDLRSRLNRELTETADARLTGDPNIFRTYKRLVRGHRLPDPNDPNPGPIEAIEVPIRERKGGELPPDSKAGVSIVIEVLAGGSDCRETELSIDIPEPLLGHPSFELVRLDDSKTIAMEERGGSTDSRSLVWTLQDPLAAHQSRRFRLIPTDSSASSLSMAKQAEGNQPSEGPPWVYIIHGLE
jgi:N-sulfoglucosamine sulfohydrolase